MNEDAQEFSKKLSSRDIKSTWLYKGVNVGDDGNMRCPHCNWILAKGLYSRSPQKFICPKCKGTSEFQMLT